MRAQVTASRKAVVWKDRSEDVLSQRIIDEVISPRDEVRGPRIITDYEPIDTHLPPRAARLISTTAGVQDYIDVPNSLSFIRCSTRPVMPLPLAAFVAKCNKPMNLSRSIIAFKAREWHSQIQRTRSGAEIPE
jgi:hypothetical protein